MDDIRPKGYVTVPCAACEPGWCIWVDCLDPRLPDGPFFCMDHDPDYPLSPCDGCGTPFRAIRLAGRVHKVFCTPCWNARNPPVDPHARRV